MEFLVRPAGSFAVRLLRPFPPTEGSPVCRGLVQRSAVKFEGTCTLVCVISSGRTAKKMGGKDIGAAEACD